LASNTKVNIAAPVLKAMREAIRAENVLTEIGEYLVKNIKASVRQGKDPETGKAYDVLKQSTINHRRYIAKYNFPGQFYSESKSNLNLSGQLVDSISFKADKGSNTVTIAPGGSRDSYYTKEGKPIDKPHDNLTIAKWHQEGTGKIP
jgi:hypothetical protein